MNKINIKEDCFLMIGAIAFAITIKNVFNLYGATVITPLFDQNGCIGLLLPILAMVIALFFDSYQNKVYHYFCSISLGCILANSTINGHITTVAVVLGAICIYLLKHFILTNTFEGAIYFLLSFSSILEIFSLLYIIRSNSFGRIDKPFLTSMLIDCLLILSAFSYMYRARFVLFANKKITNTVYKTSFILFLFTTIAYLAYASLFVNYEDEMDRYNVYILCFVYLLFLYIILIKEIRHKKARTEKLMSVVENLDSGNKILMMVLGSILFAICVSSLGSRNGPIFTDNISTVYSSISKGLHLATSEPIYKGFIFINAILVVISFYIIKLSIISVIQLLTKSHALYDGSIDNHSKRNYRLYASIIAFVCSNIPEILSYMNQAKSLPTFVYLTVFWITIYYILQFLLYKDLTIIVKCSVYALIGIILYALSEKYVYSLANVSLQIFIILISLLIYIWVPLWYNNKYRDKEKMEGSIFLLLILFVSIVSFEFSYSSSMRTITMHNKKNNVIKEKVTDVLNIAQGKVYYDENLDGRLQYLFREHLLLDRLDSKENYSDIGLISEEYKILDLEGYETVLSENIEKLSVDKDGYRVLPVKGEISDRLYLMPNYYFITSYWHDNSRPSYDNYESTFDYILVTQNKEIVEQLKDTDYKPKKIKKLNFDDIDIDIQGWSLKYSGYKEGVEPDWEEINEDEKIRQESVKFNISIVSNSDIEYYNNSNYNIDYHLYQNDKLIAYDNNRISVGIWVASDTEYKVIFNPLQLEKDVKNSNEFNSDEEYKLVIDLVEEGVDWVSREHPERVLTIIHHADGTWSKE